MFEDIEEVKEITPMIDTVSFETDTETVPEVV